MIVRTYVSHILGKLHLASRTQLAVYALKEDPVLLDDVSHSRMTQVATALLSTCT